MDTIDLRNKWLRAEARDRGYVVSDTDDCDLEIETYTDGCCEMCYSEVTEAFATVGEYRFSLYI